MKFKSLQLIILFILILSHPFLTYAGNQNGKHESLRQFFPSSGDAPVKCGLISPGMVESLKSSPSEKDRALARSITSRPDLHTFYISDGGHFKIHYDTTGYDAPQMLFTLDNQIPDWIILTAKYAEQAWRLLMDTLNYQPPPPDGVDGNEVDIYILNLNGNAYAWTYPTYPVLSTTRPYDYYAYTEIDNDYLESRYSTHGEDALKVTIAHEFFHIVQLGYNFYPSGIGGNSGDQYFLEMSSTWFEERAHPDVNDYVQYTAAYLYYPTFPLWSSTYWYALGIFIHYLSYQYGDQFLTDVWDEIKNREAFYALNTYLNEKGTSVGEVWSKFGISAYFVGSRDDGSHIFPDASLYPDMDMSEAYHENLQDSYTQQLTLYPFRTSFFLFYTDKSCQADINLSGAIGAAVLTKNGNTGINSLNTSNSTRIKNFTESDTLLVSVTNPSESENAQPDLNVLRIVVPFIPREIFPNPYSLAADSKYPSLEITFNRDFESGRIEIYDLLGRRLLTADIPYEKLGQGKQIISLESELRTLKINNLASGVYFIRFKIGNKSFVRRLYVIK